MTAPLAQAQQRELSYLRELLSEFAASHPEAAYLAQGRGADPSVERLLQGAALLGARLRQRVEDAFPQLIQPVFGLLWPQYLAPSPAMVLLQAQLVGQGSTTTHRIPAGTPLRVRQIGPGGSPAPEYDFTTLAPVDIAPVELISAEVDPVGPDDHRLVLRFRLVNATSFSQCRLNRIRLHLHGDLVTRFTLYHWLTQRTRRVTVEDGQGRVQLGLQSGAVRPVGFEGDDALEPAALPLAAGVRDIEDYFRFVDKYLGVELTGLDGAPRGAPGGDFRFSFHFGALEELDGVGTSNFGLCRVPAVNVSAPEPIKVPPEAAQRGFSLPGDTRAVHSVEQVRVHRDGRFHPLPRAVDKPAGAIDETGYEVRWLADFADDRRFMLRFVDRAGQLVPAPAGTELSARFWNPGLSAGTDVGFECVASTLTPGHVRFHMAGSVVPPRPSAVNPNGHLWKIMALLTMHPDDLTRKTGLVQFLRTFGLDRSVGDDPIRSVSCALSPRVYHQTVVPAREVEIVLEESSFTCRGQLCLLAGVLSRLYRRPADTSMFYRVVVRAEPSGESFVWGPQ